MKPNSSSNQIIISSYGISGEVSPDRHFSTTYPYWDEKFPSYYRFCRKYGMSPICLVAKNQMYIRPLVLIASYLEQNVISSTLDKEIELNTNLATDLAHWDMSATFRVIFYLNALRHSLVSIINAYCDMASEFSRVLAIPKALNEQLQEKNLLLSNSKLPIEWIRELPVARVGASVAGSGFGDAVFYEMVGYMASARSLLDSLVRVLKNRPSVDLPKVVVKKSKSYEKLNKNIQNCKMPDHLRRTIIENKRWTSDLIEYRDCLLHYEILSRSYLPSVTVIHSEKRIIAQFIWLPDNPKIRSIRNFTFDNHVDYLGYAHSTYLKLLNLCLYILRDTSSEFKNM
jgi:hypothetical protein